MTQFRLDLQHLPAEGAAIDPEGQVGVGGRVEIRMIEGKRVPGVFVRADGISAGMHRRSVSQVSRPPAPVRPAVLQRIVVNDLVSTRRYLKQACQCQQPA